MTQRERQEPKSCPECREFTGMGKKLKMMQGKDTGGQRSRKSDSEKQKGPPPYRHWQTLGRSSATSFLTTNLYAHFVCSVCACVCRAIKKEDRRPNKSMFTDS